MEKRNNRPIWGLFIILLIIFLIGMTFEFTIKVINVMMSTRAADRPEIIVNQVLRGFGDESIPLWAFPALGLNWMSIMPREVGRYALRWIPYLCIFFLPVLCALIPKRSIPLIICAVVNGLVAIGLGLVHLFSKNPMLNAYIAIPFAAESLMLVLACIAIGTKSKGFSIVLGVFCILFMLASPAVSAGAAAIMRTLSAPKGSQIWRFLQVQVRRLPLSAAVSYWPIYKTFAYLMYALILFVVPSRFPKRAN